MRRAMARGPRALRLRSIEHGEPIAAFATDPAVTAVAYVPDQHLDVASDAQGTTHFLALEIPT